MFFNYKGIMIVFAVIAVVVLLCAIDLSCSGKPAAESTIARVKGELAAGRAESRSQQAENLERMARDMRVMARRYVKQGNSAEARKALNAAMELDRKINELRGTPAK